MPPPLPMKKNLEVVQLWVGGQLNAKTISNKTGVTLDQVYKIREKYLEQRWVLKRHPTKDFKLT